MVIVIHFPMRANGAILPKHFVVIGTGLSFFLAWANHDMGDGKHGDETSNFLRSPKSQKNRGPMIPVDETGFPCQGRFQHITTSLYRFVMFHPHTYQPYYMVFA